MIPPSISVQVLESGFAGRETSEVDRGDLGVYVGISISDYSRLFGGLAGPYTAIGGALSAVAGRVSYCFGARGPSLVVDTA